MPTLAEEFKEKISSIKAGNIELAIARAKSEISDYISRLNSNSSSNSFIPVESEYVESTRPLVEWAREQGFNVHLAQEVIGSGLIQHVILRSQETSEVHVNLDNVYFTGVSV